MTTRLRHVAMWGLATVLALDVCRDETAVAQKVRESLSDDFAAKADRLFSRKYSFHPWIESDHTIAGEDWSLPPWVKAAPYSGILINPARLTPDFPGRVQRSVRATWREVEPDEGKFDFGPLHARLLAASENGKYAVTMGLEASVWETRYFRGLQDSTVDHVTPGSAPQWLKNYSIAIVEEKPNSSTPFQVVNLDIYNPEYHKRYLKLVAEFGKSGIPQMKELDLCYVHLVSASRGEEGSGPPLDNPNRNRYEERMRAWAAAFRGVEHKLCHVSGKEEDLQLCTQLGMGQRNGFVEHYLLHVPNPMLGQELDADGYLIANEKHPLIAENRASGDENEEYRNEVRFGPIETFPHRYHESMLRALQMRRNFLWAEGGPWFVNPPLLHYVGLELGKTARTAPDAWCYLRESYIPGRKNNRPEKAIPVKNFERWLFQRDAEGARTEPTERVEVPKQMFEFEKGHLYEFTARTTQRSQGQTRICFGVDDTFLAGGPHPVVVKITYLDRGNARWILQYRDSPATTAIRQVRCGDSGKVRTVTFVLGGVFFPGKGFRGEDLQIQAMQGDAVIRLVRLVKLTRSNSIVQSEGWA